MITKEKFEQIELQYGCGYWHVCDDHACYCSPDSPVGQGFNEETYKSMQKARYDESERLHREMVELDRELARYEAMEIDYDEELEYFDDEN